MWFEAHRNRIRVHPLQFEHLPQSFHNFRIFFISDVHRRLLPLSVIEKWKKQVDFVVIGGDLCEKGVLLKRVEENLKRLSQLGPTAFVWGNNDEEIGTNQLKNLFNKYGIHELNNTVKIIERNSERIMVGGVDDVGHERDDVTAVIAKSQGTFSILVSHYPDIVRKLPKGHPFSIVLSGHTHGGQIRLLGWGLKEKGKLHQYSTFVHLISNGYGTTCLPLRLGAQSEMHVLLLQNMVNR